MLRTGPCTPHLHISPWCCCCISINSQQRTGKAKPLGPLTAVLITLWIFSIFQHHLCTALDFLKCWYTHCASGCFDVDRRGKRYKSHHHRADDLASPEKLGLWSSYSLQKADTHTLGLWWSLLLTDFVDKTSGGCGNSRALSWRCSSRLVWGVLVIASSSAVTWLLKHPPEMSPEPKIAITALTVRMCKLPLKGFVSHSTADQRLEMQLPPASTTEHTGRSANPSFQLARFLHLLLSHFARDSAHGYPKPC